MRGWLRRLSKLPPWVDSPPPLGWPEALWAAMWAIRYLLALVIVLGLVALLFRLPV